MVRVIWTQEALNDLENIFEYLQAYSLHLAKLFLQNILNKTKSLKNNPQMGRIIPEISKKNHREIFYKSYRIMYKQQQNIVYITAIYHGARDYEP